MRLRAWNLIGIFIVTLLVLISLTLMDSQASGVVQFAFAHISLGVCSADHVAVIDQSAAAYGRVQAVRSQFAAAQS